MPKTCFDCKLHKANSQFSKAQLKKPDNKRRCTDCLAAQNEVETRTPAADEAMGNPQLGNPQPDAPPTASAREVNEEESASSQPHLLSATIALHEDEVNKEAPVLAQPQSIDVVSPALVEKVRKVEAETGPEPFDSTPAALAEEVQNQCHPPRPSPVLSVTIVEEEAVSAAASPPTNLPLDNNISAAMDEANEGVASIAHKATHIPEDGVVATSCIAGADGSAVPAPATNASPSSTQVILQSNNVRRHDHMLML